MLYGIDKFLERVAKLADSGAIDADTARAIEGEFAGDLQKSALIKRLFSHVLLYALGAVLLGFGLKIFAESIWHNLTLVQRTFFAMAPLAISIVCALCAEAANASKPWREAAALFNAVGVVCAISITANIWQIEGSNPDFYAAVFLLTFPVALLLNSGLTAAFAAIMLVMFSVDRGVFSFPEFSLAFFCISAAVLAAHSIYKVGRGDNIYKISTVFAAVFFPLGLSSLSEFDGTYESAFYACAYGAIAAFAAGKQAGFLRLAMLVVFVCVSVPMITFSNAWFAERQRETDWVAVCCCVACCAVWLAEFIAGLRRGDADITALALSALAPFGLLCCGLFVAGFFGAIPMCAAAFTSAVGLFVLAVGVKKASIPALNSGLAIFVPVLLSIVLAYNRQLPLEARSAVLIVSGALVISLNIAVAKRR